MLRRWFVAAQDVFSTEELARLRGFPEINRAELIRHFDIDGELAQLDTDGYRPLRVAETGGAGI